MGLEVVAQVLVVENEVKVCTADTVTERTLLYMLEWRFSLETFVCF